MADNGKSFGSLRFNRFDIERLAVVLVFSLAAHLVAIGGYELGKELNLMPWLKFLTRVKPLPQQVQQEPPVEFAMVENPSPVAPKNAKYYGAQNSMAGDQSHGNQNEVELKGTQTEVPKTEAEPRSQFDQLQPQLPAQESPPATEPGDLVLAKPSPTQPQTPERPRKLSQVKHVPGPQMQQNGGMHEFRAPSFDVKGTTFGVYDQKFIEAVTQRWYDLLDGQNYALDRQGKVVLQFHLNYDGTITDMQVLQNSVGALLGSVCEDAIRDPAPYQPWPEEMRHTIGKTSREITFTFYYY